MVSESQAQREEHGPSAIFGSSTTPLTMYVVRANEELGSDAVSLGELLELRIETTGRY